MGNKQSAVLGGFAGGAAGGATVTTTAVVSAKVLTTEALILVAAPYVVPVVAGAAIGATVCGVVGGIMERKAILKRVCNSRVDGFSTNVASERRRSSSNSSSGGGNDEPPRNNNNKRNNGSSSFDYNLSDSELADLAKEIQRLCDSLRSRCQGNLHCVSHEDATFFQVELESLMRRFILGGGGVSFKRRARTLTLTTSGGRTLATLFEPEVLNACGSLFDGSGSLTDHPPITKADLRYKGPMVYLLQCKHCQPGWYTQGTYIGISTRGCARFREHEHSIATGKKKSIVDHLCSEHGLNVTDDANGATCVSSTYYTYRILIRIPADFPGDVKKALRAFEVFYEWFLGEISNKR